VAFSCLAGAEHTGRGGFRVYTVNVVFDGAEFCRCAFNPFNVIRAMATTGLTQPALKPPQVLPKIDLKVALNATPGAGPCLPAPFGKPYRGRVLELALASEEVLVDLPQSWIGAAEAILLGLPGEMRQDVSFSAGLRPSSNRKHRLQFLRDDKNSARSRVASQGASYINVADEAPSVVRDSAWLTFVERHWQVKDFRQLGARTSRTFAGTSPSDLEDAGALYNLIDSVDTLPAMQTLELVSAQLRGKQSSANSDLADEFLARAQAALNQRMAKASLTDWAQAWRPLLGVWRQSPEGSAFAWPVIRSLTQTWLSRDAMSAAEAVLDLTRDVPAGANQAELESTIETVLGRLGTEAARLANAEPGRVDGLLSKWHRVRPNSPALASIMSNR
jgi:hypothetical protein